MAMACARVVASGSIGRLHDVNRSEDRSGVNVSTAARGRWLGAVARSSSRRRRRGGVRGGGDVEASLQGSDRGGGRDDDNGETRGVGAFPKLRPLARCRPLTARRDDDGNIGVGSTRTRSNLRGGGGGGGGSRHVVIVYASFGDPDSAGFNDGTSGGGFGKLATEEEAEADAAARLSFLKALVMKKRLYFAILEACELVEGEVPDGKGAPKLASIADLEELEHVADAYEERCDVIQECEAQAAKLETMLAGMGDASAAAGDTWSILFPDDPAQAERTLAAKVNACRADLTKHAAALLKSLPYRSLEDTQSALDEARERLNDEDSSSVVAKTVERVGSKVKSTRGLLKTGVSRLREKPLVAAVSAAEYTKGVWVRLNGGMDGSGVVEPNLVGLPLTVSKAEERQARVLRLSLEVQDRDKALSEASKARDGVMGKDSLSRVRLAQEIRASDDKVSVLRRIFAVRTLQVEMERIVMQLEEEAAEAPSLDAPDRSDEVELLVAEFGAMDSSLRKLVSMVDRGAAELINDEDLTVLATDIPDLKSRLGIADDGMTSLSLDLIWERIVRTTKESIEKTKEGAEFMARGVKMLGADCGASARFFGRAVMGSTLRPREVQTIRRTTLDIFTFVPFVIILIIPLTPVGHVLIFSFIQRYFPALFPSQFSGRRQELMKKYEELREQLKAAEKSKEMREEDEALMRAVSAVESLMMGGGSDSEVEMAMKKGLPAAAGAGAGAGMSGGGGGGGERRGGGGGFFKLKGLERRPESSSATMDDEERAGNGDGDGDVRGEGERGEEDEGEEGEEAATGASGGAGGNNPDSELEDLRKRTMSAATTLSLPEEEEEEEQNSRKKGGKKGGKGNTTGGHH